MGKKLLFTENEKKTYYRGRPPEDRLVSLTFSTGENKGYVSEKGLVSEDVSATDKTRTWLWNGNAGGDKINPLIVILNRLKGCRKIFLDPKFLLRGRRSKRVRRSSEYLTRKSASQAVGR